MREGMAMPQGWMSTTLGEVLAPKGYIRGPFGSALRRNELLDQGIPVYEQQHAIYGIRDFRFFISPEKFKEMKRFETRPDDLLISCSGTLGRVSIIREDDPKGIISQALLLLRANTEIIVPKYLQYFFSSKKGYDSIVSRSSGSVQVNISKRADIEKIPLELPPIDVQKTIVDTLLALDDKIENNTAINHRLEQMAQTLFERIIIEESLDQPLGILSDIAQINPPRTLPKGSKSIYVEMANLPTHSSFPTDWAIRPYSGGMKFKNGDTIMARITPCLENGKTAYINFLDNNVIAFGSTEYIVLAAKDGYCSELLYFLARYSEFVSYAVGNMNGSSGRQRVSGETIGQYEMHIPSPKSVKAFAKIANPAMDLIRQNSLENRRLANIRDTLLPRLMSGELSVSNI
jgi:type I restriction enzyme S subunit